jgi:superfamily II DNA helicase RecQ
MRLKHFTIPALDSTSGEEDLNRFLAAHRILNIERQFIQNGTHSHWCYAINYQELDDRPAQVKKRGKVDYKELLSERDFAIYSRLRDLRKRLAEQEGVPVYALCTNEQMAAMVQQRIGTLAQMQAIDGIGEGRVRKYGQAFLDLLKTAEAELPHPSGEQNEA